MTDTFLTGILLGVSAGFAPGPLLALVVSETMRHGVASGTKVALAPVVTDLPIVVLSLFVLSKLSEFNMALGCISLLGGVFVFYMGCENFRTLPSRQGVLNSKSDALAKGILVNFLSPHPYLFWITVGAPIVIRSWKDGLSGPAFFIVGFYCMLVGSKIFLALLTGKSKSFLGGKKYTFIMRFLGVLLCLLGLFLVRDGFVLLGFSSLS